MESSGQRLKVKDFAKYESCDVEQPVCTDVISLSSDDDFLEQDKIVVAKKEKARKPPKTPKATKMPKLAKPRTPRLPRLTQSRRKIWETPLKFENHKISEYFPSSKKDFKIEPKNLSPENAPKEMIDNNENDTQNLKARLRSAKRTLRRLSIEKNVITSRKRNVQTDQPKVSSFIEYENADGVDYFSTYSQAALPNNSSNDLPIENIQLSNPAPNSNNPTSSDRTTSSSWTTGSSNSISETSTEKSKKNRAKATAALKRTKNAPKEIIKAKRTKPICPAYKIVEGTQFAVDAFRYGDIDGVKCYFLTHFHADHYIGLNKSFAHTLYLSCTTGRLVNEFLKIGFDRMHLININEPFVLDDIEVTAVDANHCLGAVMFLFKLPTGKCILHTGDFRASHHMEEYPIFWNNQIDTIYLDTTYLSSKYDFDLQMDCVREIEAICKSFVEECKSLTGKPLIVCGAYKVGKEMVWIRIAQSLNLKVWVDDERRRLLNCIGVADVDTLLTRCATDASIHVLTLGSVTYPRMVNYMAEFDETYSKLLGIRPSGWEKKSTNFKFKNRINIISIPYSEHSSYSELERFVRFLQPKTVIATVPYNGKDITKTPSVPDAWLNASVTAKTKSYQRRIEDFMVNSAKQKKTSRK